MPRRRNNCWYKANYDRSPS